MKRLVLLLVLCASITAAAEDDGTVTMTAAERAFLAHRFMQMQERIDELEKQLQTEKERTGCA